MEVKYKNNNKEIFAPLKMVWLVATPEEIIRQETICKLVDEFGYQLEQMEQELSVTNSKRGHGSARADIVIWKSESDRKERKNAFIVVECKAEFIKLSKEDYAQGENYAAFTKAQFFVITNKKERKYFKVLDNQMPPDACIQILEIPKADEIGNEKRIKEILGTEKFFSKDDFQKILFECHNIIRNNDKLSPEAAFDEISKILFTKIMFERDKNRLFSKKNFLEVRKQAEELEKHVGKQSNEPYYKLLFNQTKEKFKNDEIFEDNATLRIREESFLSIVEKLQNYNLSDTDDDVKGIAFEEFLGTTFRGDLGQYFTPRTVVNFMVDILDPQEGELVCDPCCGSGGFLIKTFEHIREKIEKDIKQAKEKIRKELYLDNYSNLSLEQKQEVNAHLNQCITELEKDLDKDGIVLEEGKPSPSRLKRLSSMCIFGTDAESRSARTAKMNMIMHGDGHGGVHYHDGLWNVNGIFEDRFDVIITNPPFGSRVSKDFVVKLTELLPSEEKKSHYESKYGEAYTNAYQKTIERFNSIQSNRKKNNKQLDANNEGVPLTAFYDTGEMSGLTEVLFMERCLNLLKEGGRMGVVLPEGFLNGSDLQRVREYFEGKAKILLIVSLPQEIFVSAGASVKSSLVFLKKFTTAEQQYYNQIKTQVTHEIEKKYKAEKAKTLQLFATKKELKKAEDELNKKMEAEIKATVKERFDYDIAMAQVEKAGINSTGQKTDNQLFELRDEFGHYRKEAGLWKSEAYIYKYGVLKNGAYQRNFYKEVV